MKRIKLQLLIPALLIISVQINAQAKKLAANDLIGNWKGTSLCQVKNSPCHDEMVIYYISKGNTADSITISANKIVNGVEEEMGILHFKIDAVRNEFVSTEYKSLWKFTLDEA